MPDFTFPDDKALNEGTIKNFFFYSKKYNYELIDINKPIENVISIDKVDYYFTYLDKTGKNKGGGNSIILKLYEASNIDTENVNYETPDLILKILKSKIKGKYPSKITQRFLKEIKALDECQTYNFQNVIKLHKNGCCKIFNPDEGKYDSFFFYTLEYAEFDLKGYIEKNHKSLTLETKLSLCINIAKGIQELNSLGYYHRDIKPDNIFMIEDNWKIGDLGLLGERTKFNNVDDIADAIGPRGWMSPESMNKYLTEKKGFRNTFNCDIDHQSDIFQLGKVFWYIFQHNAPIGLITEKDFVFGNNHIYELIEKMLSHSKSTRHKSIQPIISVLDEIDKNNLKLAN